VDAIAEVKVLTSNYGAQYGRNASGTVEVETKSAPTRFTAPPTTTAAMSFFNARNFFDDPNQPKPAYKSTTGVTR